MTSKETREETRNEALIRLMKRHQADLWRYLRFLGADAATADDLTQDTFIFLYRNPIVEHDDRHTGAWLRTTARHKLLNRIRDTRREVAIDMETADAVWAKHTPESGSDDRIEALGRCLEKLADRARQAIELKYCEGLTEADVGEAMKASVEAAKALLKRARQQLRECVESRVRQ